LQLPADKGNRVELPFSQRQLAAYLGIRAETLSRLLAQWQAREWLSGERRHWTLLDTTPLRRLAGALVRTF
jgi:CRP-like cAMP-binding protein